MRRPDLQGTCETLLGSFLISSIGRSVRVREGNRDRIRNPLFQPDRGAIISFWHNRLFYLTYYFATRLIANGVPTSVLISQSRDGEKIARIAERFGCTVVRGSTSQKGTGAFRSLLRLGRQNRTIAITPDGPRGPKYRVQRGAALLSVGTGLPVIPVTYGVTD